MVRDKASSDPIYFTGLKNHLLIHDGEGMTYAQVSNDVVNGQSNDFTAYFTASIGDGNTDKPYIILNRKKEIPATMKSISGWITYTQVSIDGKTTITRTEKITITFK